MKYLKTFENYNDTNLSDEVMIMYNNLVHSIKIECADLDTYLIMSMGYEETLNYILRKECRRRFGSVENFLRKIELGEYVDKIKEGFGK